ncbi:MAG: 2-oxo-tetronate isomerase [Pseudomonadota bacterium]
MPKFCANLSMLFNEHPFLDRFEAAARAGFRAVEFLFPYDYEATEVRDALKAAGLEMALFNAPPGDWEAGERGMAAIPGRMPEFRESFETALAYAEVLQPHALHIMAGNAAGKGAQAMYMENLEWAASRADHQKLTIEPINTRDMPSYFLNRSDQAIGIIEAIGAPNLQVQFDLYHAQIMEGDLTRRLERIIGYVGHMQIAGVPERHEPDTGELNILHMFDVMDRLGYNGWVGCEYRPAGRTEDGLGWFEPYKQG